MEALLQRCDLSTTFLPATFLRKRKPGMTYIGRFRRRTHYAPCRPAARSRGPSGTGSAGRREPPYPAVEGGRLLGRDVRQTLPDLEGAPPGDRRAHPVLPLGL